MVNAIAPEDVAAAFIAAGFWREDFLSCWMMQARGLTITVSDENGPNDEDYEVQVTADDGTFVAGSDGDQTPASAIAFALAELAKVPA
jgi:hypothetical protein